MDRTKAIDNVAVRPAPSGSTHAAGYFGDGTTVEAEWMNGVQEALIVPLEDGGITPDTDDYEQFATLLSGVHGIVTDVRSDLATTGASTMSKRAASAVINAIAAGNCSQCNAGANQAANGNYSQCNAGTNQAANGACSQCNAGENQAANGIYSQCNAGWNQTAHGTHSQCNAGWNQTAHGNYSQCNAGWDQDAHGACSQCNAGEHQRNSGERASVVGGRYCENVDDDCVCGGFGSSAPVDFGDGLTNKNIKWKLHSDTGNAEFAGKIANILPGSDVVFDDGVEVEGDLAVGGELDLHVIDLGDLTCDWDTTGTDTQKSAVGVALTYDTAHAVAYFDLTINNTSGGVVDLNLGETIFCSVANSNPGTIIGAFCKTTSATGASAATLMSLRMMATACEDGGGNPVIALVSVSAKAIPIPASAAGSVTVRCYLQYATLS